MGEDYYVSEEQSAEALKAISEGGEYSIGAVADRIMEFAEAIAGDDPEKVAEMTKAYEAWAKRCMVEPYPGQKKK